jgi:hypothetical protein
MKRRKRDAEDFDVSAFLRETDSDLRSALTTMLQPGSNPEAPVNLIPGTSLGPDLNKDPGVISSPPVTLTAEGELTGDPSLGAPPALGSAPEFPAPAARPGSGSLRPVSSGSAIAAAAASAIAEPVTAVSGAHPVAPPADPITRRHIHPATSLHDGHTRAERHVYETLWKLAEPFDAHSRLVTLGFATLGRLADLSESNARINLRSLVRKLAVEEFESYDCAQSRGRTYRIFDEAAVLERRREAGLVWYRKRTMGVVFVDGETGEAIR